MPDQDSTRSLDTLSGVRLYSELVPQLALGVERVMRQLALMPPEEIRYSYGFILDLHRNAFSQIVAWAGQPRKHDVTIRQHLPPPHYLVRELLARFAGDLEYRSSLIRPEEPELEELVEILAFCEGQFTNIHPFADFNGRVSRMLSWSLLLRLGLPATVELVPAEGDETARQGLWEALQAYDHRDPEPLRRIWKQRLTHF